jgi:hypothetical protein
LFNDERAKGMKIIIDGLGEYDGHVIQYGRKSPKDKPTSAWVHSVIMRCDNGTEMEVEFTQSEGKDVLLDGLELK